MRKALENKYPKVAALISKYHLDKNKKKCLIKPAYGHMIRLRHIHLIFVAEDITWGKEGGDASTTIGDEHVSAADIIAWLGAPKSHDNTRSFVKLIHAARQYLSKKSQPLSPKLTELKRKLDIMCGNTDSLSSDESVINWEMKTARDDIKVLIMDPDNMKHFPATNDALVFEPKDSASNAAIAGPSGTAT